MRVLFTSRLRRWYYIDALPLHGVQTVWFFVYYTTYSLIGLFLHLVLCLMHLERHMRCFFLCGIFVRSWGLDALGDMMQLRDRKLNTADTQYICSIDLCFLFICTSVHGALLYMFSAAMYNPSCTNFDVVFNIIGMKNYNN